MIITLCGSLRFEEEFKEMDERLTLCGHTVFTVSVYPSTKGDKNWYNIEIKAKLDAAHLRKIDLSDAIVVICPGGYIGSSTASEIQHAFNTNKQVYISETNITPVVMRNMGMGLVKRMCPYKGCHDPILNHPPCPLCYVS